MTKLVYNCETKEQKTVERTPAEIVLATADAEKYVLDGVTLKRIATRMDNAKNEAALATALKALTPDYIESNVATLAQAKAVMKIMVRLLIALRDATWPDLAE